MAVTSTQSKAPASVANIAVGRYLTSSTASAITITTGFKPRYVKVVNLTGNSQYEWFEGMADDSAWKLDDQGSTEAGLSLITSLGITVSATGFVIGLDLDVNVINEQISWIAMG